MIRWTKELPFGILLVHRSLYDSVEQALADKSRIEPEIAGFLLQNDDEIARSHSYKILVPFKERNSEK